MVDPITGEQIVRILEQAAQDTENPLPVRRRIEWYIQMASWRLENLESEEERNSLLVQLGNQLANEKGRKARRKIIRKMNSAVSVSGDLQALIREARIALDHFEVADLDRMLQAYDRMHEYRALANLPLLETEKGRKARTGYVGDVRRALRCFCDSIDSDDDAMVFSRWQKASDDIILQDEQGDKWQFYAERINWREGLDADNLNPEDFKYYYYKNGSSDGTPVTVANIRKSLSRNRES
jgi:hypothetical protein